MPIGDGVGDCLSAAAAMSAMQREEPEVRDKLAQILKLALASFGFGKLWTLDFALDFGSAHCGLIKTNSRGPEPQRLKLVRLTRLTSRGRRNALWQVVARRNRGGGICPQKIPCKEIADAPKRSFIKLFIMGYGFVCMIR